MIDSSSENGVAAVGETTIEQLKSSKVVAMGRG